MISASNFTVANASASASDLQKFNSALQYLQQSPTVTTILQQMVEKGVTVKLPFYVDNDAVFAPSVWRAM